MSHIQKTERTNLSAVNYADFYRMKFTEDVFLLKSDYFPSGKKANDRLT